MKSIIYVFLATALAGCQGVHDKTDVRVSDSTLNVVDPPRPCETRRPDHERLAEGYLPGTDKIYFLGDRKVVRTETDARPVLIPEPTRRLLVGNAEEGDPSLQPALLQRELAEELARSREINAQNRVFMAQMMAGTKELIGAMDQLKQYNKELTQRLEKQADSLKLFESQKETVTDGPGGETGGKF